MRVVTYNLRDLKDDRAALLRVIAACRPDVLCAQEVPRRLLSGWRVRRLARSAGLVAVAGGRASGGTAVLVSPRLRVVSCEAARLPVERWWTRTRGYAAATVAAPGGGVLTVVSVHLGLSPLQRADHAERILSRLRELAEPPYVVAGDLNETPDGPSWQAFGAVVRDAVAALSLGDHALRGDHAPRGAPTFPARGPRRRIDAVLLSDGVEVLAVHAGAEVEGVCPEDLERASDHVPVVTDLRVGEGRRTPRA